MAPSEQAAAIKAGTKVVDDTSQPDAVRDSVISLPSGKSISRAEFDQLGTQEKWAAMRAS
ncbi:MAG: hypothetical protein GY947_12440 [Rhodobacteraceae bacterium]|nr:hypothetical protein [Paracoccaceae bacterium]